MNTRNLCSRSRPRIATLTIIAAALALVSFLQFPAVGSAETDGRVTGVVTNGTAGTPLANAEVVLSQFERQAPESVDITATTDSAGRFTFEGLDTAQGLVYAVSVRYERVLYSTGMIVLSEEPQQEIQLTVFETTRDESVVNIQARGVIIAGVDSEEGVVTVADVYVLHNPSTQTFIGDEEGRSIRFTIPENTLEVTPRSGFDFTGATVEDDVIYAASPLRPGTVNASLEYALPYSGTSVSIPLKANYPSGVVRVLLPVAAGLDEIQVTGAGSTLVDQGVLDIEGRQYRVWVAGEQTAGSTLTLHIGNLPRTSLERNELRTLEPALVALLAFVIACAVSGWVIVRRGLHRPRPIVLAPAAALPLAERRDELTQQLRELESDWQEQHVDEPAYRASRRAILEELRSISRQYRGIGDDE
jgi:5-hydroxyisourate hydrolase-like protein (transthyretin family)